MSELKKCPFCGGSNIYVDGYDHDAGKRWRVVCLDCMATVDDGCVQQKYRAIAAWNRRADGWIPVGKRLPKHREKILVFTGALYPIQSAEYNTMADDGCAFEVPGEQDEWWADVTHWMPLPEPPKGETTCSD